MVSTPISVQELEEKLPELQRGESVELLAEELRLL